MSDEVGTYATPTPATGVVDHPAGQLLQVARENTSSVELQRAKDGTYYWTIKVYFDADAGKGDEDYALEQIERTDGRLRVTYLPTAERES